MKKLLSLGVLAGVAVLLAACGSGPLRGPTVASEQQPLQLQILVDVPPTMNVLAQENVAEAFGQRLSMALHEQGLQGRIRYVPHGDFQEPLTPVLAATLREWRVDETGKVDCTFTAELRTVNGTQVLGAFNGTSIMSWSRPGWSDRQPDFEEVVHYSLDTLGQRLTSTGLMPAL